MRIRLGARYRDLYDVIKKWLRKGKRRCTRCLRWYDAEDSMIRDRHWCVECSTKVHNHIAYLLGVAMVRMYQAVELHRDQEDSWSIDAAFDSCKRILHEVHVEIAALPVDDEARGPIQKAYRVVDNLISWVGRSPM